MCDRVEEEPLVLIELHDVVAGRRFGEERIAPGRRFRERGLGGSFVFRNGNGKGLPDSVLRLMIAASPALAFRPEENSRGFTCDFFAFPCIL